MYKSPLKRLIGKIREVNRKYSKPRTHMSRTVKFMLLFLRLYLIFLVLIVVYRLIITLSAR
jgi:hypothetical protein